MANDSAKVSAEYLIGFVKSWGRVRSANCPADRSCRSAWQGRPYVVSLRGCGALEYGVPATCAL